MELLTTSFPTFVIVAITTDIVPSGNMLASLLLRDQEAMVATVSLKATSRVLSAN